METSPLGDMQAVRARLAKAGYPSVRAWAQAHGYLPVTVRRTIYWWGMRTDQPLGGIGRQIIADLRLTVDGDERHVA